MKSSYLSWNRKPEDSQLNEDENLKENCIGIFLQGSVYDIKNLSRFEIQN